MLFIITGLAATWLLAYFRAHRLAWTGLFAVLLALWTYADRGSCGGFVWAAWAIFLSIAAVVDIYPLRRALIAKPFFNRFREMMPPLSGTEREALEAGTVWWDGELFTGNPDWRRLIAIPKPELREEEQHFLDTSVEELCRMLDDWRIVAEIQDLPQEAWRFIKEKRFFGMIIPKEYGGLGFSAYAHSQVITKLASRSVAAAVTVMVPNALGPAELLLHYGTREQKEYYLPRLARGEEIPCFALTGPEAGSDAASIPDSGLVCRGNFGGKEIIGIRLNWDKRYITLGPVATLLGLAFRLHDPEHLLGAEAEPGITLALIPVNTQGITIGSRHNPLGIPFQNGPNRGENVFIPSEWVVGGNAGIGQGWRMLMECLASGRSISLPSLSTGEGKFAARAVGAYAAIRKQFHLPIGRFEGVEEALARIAGNLYVMDAARRMTCGAIDLGERPSVISAIVKYQCTERLRKLVNDGMDVLGGSGICLGPRNLLGRLYQAAPIGITIEGANILTRSMIIFGQGAIRCHPFLLKEIQAVGNPDIGCGVADFDRHITKHAAFTFSNAARALFHGITGGCLAGRPPATPRRFYRAATRFCAAFALTADAVLLALGGALKRRERISARLSDILSNLYLISALLKHFKDRQEPSDELPLLEWGCEDCLHKIQESFVELFENLPFRAFARMLRLFIFPTGRHHAGPSDDLGSRVAQILTKPSSLRDRLTAGLFVPADLFDPLGRLEDALSKVTAAEPAERRLREAVKDGRIPKQPEVSVPDEGVRAGIISEDQAEIVRQAAAARRQVIRVDDFPNL